MKSEEYKLILHLRKQSSKKKIEEKQSRFLSFKPARKNINYSFYDSSTYSIIENMTKYKNKEINNNQLNLNISIILSFLITKCDKKKNHIKNFDIYYPMNRITNTENNYNNFFLPYLDEINSNKNKNSDTSYNSAKESLESSFIYDEENNSLSLISDDSLMTNNSLNKNNLKKIIKNFVRYKSLSDYIECPLIQNKNKQEKIDEFISLLNNIDNIIENDEIDKFKYYKNRIRYNDGITDGKIIMDNFDIINYEIIGNDSFYYKEKKQILLDESFIKRQKDINIINPDKQEEISNYLQKRYKKYMNLNYLLLIQNIYKRLIEPCNIIKKDNIKISTKNIFLKNFKKFLLEIEINNKIIFEKILKNQIFCDEPISFDKFIQCFDIIILDKKAENMKQKYIFILNILSSQEFLYWNKIELFFELIGCDSTYIELFSENLGDKLIKRYNAVYEKEEANNIIKRKYRLKKLRIVLESFFEQNEFNND